MHKSFTLIEVVVGVGIFAVLATMGSLLLVGILRGGKRATNTIAVRGEGANAMEDMVRLVRYATGVTACSSSRIEFLPIRGDKAAYECRQDAQGINYLASGSAIFNPLPASGRVTSPQVTLVSCNIFACNQPPPDTTTVTIGFTLSKSGSSTLVEDSSSIGFDSEVVLRNK